MGGSMGGTTKIAASKAAAADFARTKGKLDPKGRLGIIGFSSSPREALPLTAASALPVIRAAIDSLSDHGGTDISAALREAQRMFNATPSSTPQFIVLLTDGEHNGDGDPVALANELKQAGVEVYVVGFARNEAEVDARCHQIASPGKYIFCKDMRELLGQFQTISMRTSLRSVNGNQYQF